MTNPQPRPLPREDVPGPDDIREQIDAADARAEAEVAARHPAAGDGAEDVAEDVAAGQPAPEPPD
jgi:hypothetical protein